VHSAVPGDGVHDEGEISVREGGNLRRSGRVTQDNNQRSGDVVDAVPVFGPRGKAVGVLEDGDVVRESKQVLVWHRVAS
jgi:hypothetical protein